jgi:hypothetical protein
MGAYQCNRSQALRMIIDAAGAADSPRARKAAQKVREEQTRIRDQTLAPGMAEQRAVERRARRAEAARMRRAHKRTPPKVE